MAKKANDLGTRTAVLAGLAKKAEELEEQVKDLQVMRDSLINSGISKTELCKKQAKRIAELEAVYHTLDRDFVLMGQKRIELGEKVKELEAKHESMINALKSMINALRGGIELRERLTERIAYLTAELQAARKPRIWGIF
jgi:tetrahydromethanopterin S-methyltransferase subunit B